MKNIKLVALIAILSISTFITNAQNKIDQLTKDYYGVKNALVAGKANDAQNNAKTLFAALSDHPDQGLNPQQQKVLSAYIDKLKFDSRHISEVSAIEHQREHFASLSKNWYDVLKALKLNSAIVYVQYCPMKKAYWLSETSPIQNPYYSDTMPDCGKTAATLPAVK
jgi:hypothetical protein